jgi:hypothetical protein
MSDGIQSLYPEQFDELMKQIRQIAAVVGRMVPAIGDYPRSSDAVPAHSGARSAVSPLA